MSSIASVSAQRGRFARVARLAVLVGCGVAVAGCTTAVETVRSLRGSNKNDPDPVTAPFSGNVATAEAAPYPNLASVPPPPTRATTVAERQTLTEKLIAERAAAQAFAGASAAAQPAAATATVAAPLTAPFSAPSPQTTATAPVSTTRSAPPTPPAPVRMASATPQPTPARTGATGETPGPRDSNAGEPNEPLPRDSELRMPQVRSLPEPDAPRPPPAPPRLPPAPSPAFAALSSPAIASAAPQPSPSIPELAPIAPPPAVGLIKPGLSKTEPTRAPGAMTVAMLDAPDPGQIAQVAARYKESLGSQLPARAVRVIAYTAPPAPGADPLGGYHDALERAQGVAKALAAAGIPEKMIQTEAKPATGPIAAARIEIQFLP